MLCKAATSGRAVAKRINTGAKRINTGAKRINTGAKRINTGATTGRGFT